MMRFTEGDPMFKKRPSQSWLQPPKNFPNVASKYPVHLLILIAVGKVRPTHHPVLVRSEPLRSDEVAFVDGIEHHHGRALDDLVL